MAVPYPQLFLCTSCKLQHQGRTQKQVATKCSCPYAVKSPLILLFLFKLMAHYFSSSPTEPSVRLPLERGIFFSPFMHFPCEKWIESCQIPMKLLWNSYVPKQYMKQLRLLLPYKAKTAANNAKSREINCALLSVSLYFTVSYIRTMTISAPTTFVHGHPAGLPWALPLLRLNRYGRDNHLQVSVMPFFLSICSSAWYNIYQSNPSMVIWSS